MKETRTLILSAEEVEEAIHAYVFDKKGVHPSSIRFSIGSKPVNHPLDIDIPCLEGAIVQISD